MDSFFIFKNKDKVPGDNKPNYKISAPDPANSGKYVPWGAGWIKESKNPSVGKYISCTKDKPMPDKNIINDGIDF